MSIRHENTTSWRGRIFGKFLQRPVGPIEGMLSNPYEEQTACGPPLISNV